jgi:hypothetical protein
MGVQMDEMSKLGWSDGLSETCGRIPCIRYDGKYYKICDFIEVISL